MKRIFFIVLVLVVLATTSFAEESKKKNYSSIYGLGFTFNKISDDTGEVVHAGIGFSMTTMPNDKGFFGVTSLTIPLYIIADGTFLNSSGLLTDTMFGYGKTFKFVPIKSKPENKGIISLAAGIHGNFLTVYDQTGVLWFLNAGPGVAMASGNTGGSFRSTITFHYDILNYGAGNVFGEGVEFDPNNNIGATIQMGISL